MDQFLHQPVLGTNLVVGVDGLDEADADLVDDAVIAEIIRLEAIFTIFDPDSELERWKRGELDDPSPEFVEVMLGAAEWHRRSNGTFQPLTAALSALWRQGAANDTVPTATQIEAVLDGWVGAGMTIVDGRPQPAGDVSGFQLHAYAKGWIVDRGLAAGWAVVDEPTAVTVMVNAGGDIAHHGDAALTIAIENPHRRFDNDPPVDRVMVHNRGLATSGRARQGVEIAGVWYSHVIDPRSGQPVDEHASISVVSATAADADVIATIAGVEPIADALAVADDYDAACLIVDNDGELHANSAWAALRV